MTSRPPRPASSGRDGGPGKRRPSSARWLDRQARDVYVREARRQGYRSRAAFKLIDLDDRFRLLAPGRRVVDLGAAPGGWTQVAMERLTTAGGGRGRVVAVDRSPMSEVAGAEVIVADVGEADLVERLRERLGGGADTVLSDMAPAASGHADTDHRRIVALAEMALAVADAILVEGGAFVCKLWQGAEEAALFAALKTRFSTVRRAKPPSSRAESAELYLVGLGFRRSPPG